MQRESKGNEKEINEPRTIKKLIHAARIIMSIMSIMRKI